MDTGTLGHPDIGRQDTGTLKHQDTGTLGTRILELQDNWRGWGANLLQPCCDFFLSSNCELILIINRVTVVDMTLHRTIGWHSNIIYGTDLFDASMGMDECGKFLHLKHEIFSMEIV